jgi:WD40 repeat protein
LARGGETVEAGDLPVVENTDVLEVTLTYLSGEMELVLVDPTGQVVDASYPGVDIQTQENVQLITVKNPLPDQWAVRVRSGEAEGESFVYNITIGAQANPNPPSPATATSTSASPPTPAPAATSQPEPEEEIAGALSDIATPAFCIGGLLLLVALGGIAGFFIYLRRREVAVRPIHVIASAGVLILVIGCWLGALGGLLDLSNQGKSLRAIVSGATATPAATSTPAFSATPEATPTMTGTPTRTPPPPPTHTPTPTATPVPIALGPENIDQLSLRENVLDNTIAGFQSSAFFALALSPDGAMIATDGYYCPTNDCQVFVKLLQILPEGIIPLQGMVDPEMPGDQWIGIYDLDFAPDGATLASAWADNKIRIWNIADGSLARSIEAHTGVVRSLDFTSDGGTLASGSEDKTVKLWDVATGSELLSFRAANYDVYAIEFSPDDSLLAVTARDRDAFLKLYRASDGRVERSLSGHTNTPFCLSFSPDGRLLASGNYDGNILVHEVATGRLLYTLKGHTGIVWGVNFSNDGALLASAGADNTVRIWDMNDGQLLRTLEDHRSRVLKAIFSPDDSFLLSAAEFDALLLWGIQP